MNKYIYLFALLCFTYSNAMAQATCATSVPLCADGATVFDGTGGATNVATAEPDVDLGCLGSGPSPSWFYIEVATAGNIDVALQPVPAASVDYDFAMYGPFADLATAQGACGAGLGAPTDCSFAGGTGAETPSIGANASGSTTPAVVGEVYVLLVSKFGTASASFTLNQTGGGGATDCSILSACDADPGTVSITSPSFICALGQGIDKLTVVSNGDFNTAPSDPCALAGTPGVGFLVYSGTPNGGDPCLDPNFTGASLGTGPVSQPGCLNQNVEFSFGDPVCAGPIGWGEIAGVPNTNINTTFQVCPMYLFDEATMLSAVDYDCDVAEDLCGPVVGTECEEFIVLGPVLFSAETIACSGDPYLGTLSIDVSGGYPGYVTATGLDPLADPLFALAETTGNGTLSSATVADNGTITLSDIADGPYSIEVTDPNGCVHVYAGVWNQPTIDLVASASKVCQFDNDCSTANVVDLTGTITPMLGRFQICGSGDFFPGETSWQITNSTGAVVAASPAGAAIPAATGGLDPNESYSITFFDSFGDGFSCGDAAFTIADDSGAGCGGPVLYTYTAGDWVGIGCGTGDDSSFPNGSGDVFGPFPLGSPTPFIDPIGILSGTGVTDNLDNTGTFDANMAPGDYIVNYDFTDAQGCILHEETTITICANPAAPLPLEAAVLVCTTDDLTDALGVTAVADVSFDWFGPSATPPADVTTGAIATGETYTPALPAAVGVAETYWVVPSSTDPLSGLTCYGCPISMTITSEVCCVLDVTCPAGPIALECIDEVPALADAAAILAEFTAHGGAIVESCDPVVITFVDADDAAAGCAGTPRTVTRTFTVTDPVTEQTQDCPIDYVIMDVTPPTIACPSTTCLPVVYISELVPDGNNADGGQCPNEAITISVADPCGCGAGAAIDISGWELDDNTGGLGAGDPSHVFPAGTMLTVGGAPIVLACNYNNRNGQIWNNGGDDATLHDAAGVLIDIVSYTSNPGNNVPVAGVTAPTACPPPPAVLLTCADPLPPVDLTAPVVSDNCTMVGNIVVTHEGDDADPAAFSFCAADGPFVVNRTYRATDECGNFAECVQTFTYEADTEAPVIACPANVTGLTCADELPAPDPTAVVVTSDNCTATAAVVVAHISDVPDPATFSFCAADGPFVVTRTYEAADDCGNTTQCTQTFTFDADTEAPVIACPANVTGLTCADELPAPDPTAVVVTSDNCTATAAVVVAHISDVPDPATFSFCAADGPFVVTRTYEAADACGNTTQCTQTFTFDPDLAAPVITCPADVTGLTCADALPAPDPTAVVVTSENCTAVAGVVVTHISDVPDPATFSFCAVDGPFVVTRTYEATDDCGNTVQCSHTFTFDADTAPPALECPADLSLSCTDSTDPADTGVATSTGDDCSSADQIVITSVDATTQTTEGCGQYNYSITRTWTAVDACGNETSCDQTIDVADTTPPVITCPAGQTLTCFESVPAPVATAADFIALGGTIADDCTTDLTEFTVFAQNVDNGGNNCPGNGQVVTRTYFVQDACGNTSTCEQVFTYEESTQGPVITSILPTCFKSCADMANPLESDITYTTDCDFGATVTITGPDVIGQDNCPGTIYRYTYTVTDECGRDSEPVTRDIIVDNDGPSITCAPFNLILECGNPNNQDYIDTHLAQVTATTSCDLGYNITHSPTNFNLVSCGASTVVNFTVTDACGRTATCSTTIAVQDNTAPEITSTYAPGVCDEIECSGDVNYWFNHWMDYVESHISATDACDTNVSWTTSNTQINQDCSNGEAVTWVTWFANDNCGNASEVTYYFKVLDSYGPEFTFVPGEETIECDATPVFGTPIATDACGGVTFTFVDTEDTDNTCSGSYTRTWTAEDDCDNTSTASQTIFYQDTNGPVISGGSDGTAECDGNGNMAEVEAWVAANAGASAQDDCNEVASWSNDYDPANWVLTPACENGVVGYIDVAFTATDICGNAGASETYRFNVGDTTAPTFDNVPADGMIACNETPVFGMPMASDLCSNVTIDNGVDSQAGDSCNGSYTRTWTATDACGNTTTASQTLTYSDTEGPVFTFVPADGESGCVDADGNITTYAQICSSSDDAEEDTDNGEMDLASSDLELIIDDSQDKEVVVGLRFKELNIPAGANITAAWIQFTADATIDVDPSALEIHGEDSDNAATFTLEDDNITDRPTTSASVEWEPGDWDVIGDNLLAERTSDLSEIVQEIVDRGGYTAESALAFIIEGIGKRTAISWDGNPDQAPQLFVKYEAADPFGEPTATDNCDGNVTFTHTDSFDNTDGCAGSMTRTWTASDACGNTTNASQTINFSDNTPPVFTFVPAHIEIACQDANFPVQFGTPEAYDNCDDVTITHEDFWALGDETTCDEDDEDSDYRRVWTATDACGNTTTAMQRYSFKESFALFGTIATEDAQTVENVSVSLSGFNGMTQMNQSGSNGQYGFFDLPLTQNYTVIPALDVDPLNGVSSFDLVLISQHILQTNLLDSPYKMIAADINGSGGITTMDLLELRKLILHIDEDFQNNTSWRFVESAFVFPQANNPFASIFPEDVYINGLTEGEQHDFVGVKVGDVNGSVVANVLAEAEDRTFVGDLAFDVRDQRLNAGETYTVNFKANNFEAIHGYQFTLNFDQTALEFEKVQAADLINMSENNFGLALLNQGVITTSWTNEDAQSLVRGSDVFQVTFTAKANVQLSEVINVSSRYTKAEAYNGNLDLMNVTLRFDEGQVATSNTQLYQNTPNPFKSTTVIGFEFPEATSATLSIYDVSGRLLKQVEGDYAKGYNEVSVSKSDLQATGVVYYKLVTADFEKTMKMMIVK